MSKTDEEIEELRDRIAELATSESIESGSTQWHKLEASEATLDWVLGEFDGYEQLIDSFEHE